ncbi:hypothetical protein BJY52DRAFT_512945 [Lactarius psammicola]|nr:hypothetical protein BJY52DRAFT_512945 [Lactarius psammicola]
MSSSVPQNTMRCRHLPAVSPLLTGRIKYVSYMNSLPERKVQLTKTREHPVEQMRCGKERRGLGDHVDDRGVEEHGGEVECGGSMPCCGGDEDARHGKGGRLVTEPLLQQRAGAVLGALSVCKRGNLSRLYHRSCTGSLRGRGGKQGFAIAARACTHASIHVSIHRGHYNLRFPSVVHPARVFQMSFAIAIASAYAQSSPALGAPEEGTRLRCPRTESVQNRSVSMTESERVEAVEQGSRIESTY